jgi:hypothetical protein
MCPGRTGVVIGIDSSTPPFATLTVLPLKNLFASGSQMLTGQERVVRIALRFSTKVSASNTCAIIRTPLTKNCSSLYRGFIGNVNLDKIAKTVKLLKMGNISKIKCMAGKQRCFYRMFVKKIFIKIKGVKISFLK